MSATLHQRKMHLFQTNSIAISPNRYIFSKTSTSSKNTPPPTHFGGSVFFGGVRYFLEKVYTVWTLDEVFLVWRGYISLEGRGTNGAPY